MYQTIISIVLQTAAIYVFAEVVVLLVGTDESNYADFSKYCLLNLALQCKH